MGFRNFGSLVLIFLIFMMIFGTQRLREIGNDLAIAIRSFRKGLQEPENEQDKEGTTKKGTNKEETIKEGAKQ